MTSRITADGTKPRNRNERTAHVFKSIAEQEAKQAARIAALEAQNAELMAALKDTEWQARYLASRAFVGGVKRDDCEAALLVHCDNARAVLAKYQEPSP